MTQATSASMLNVQPPAALRASAVAELDRMRRHRVVERIWEADPALWDDPGCDQVQKRLGWLRLPQQIEATLSQAQLLREARREARVDTVILIGMGGSSLGAAMLEEALPSPGGTRLHCLDSTHPDAVRACLEECRPESTWVIVASKSGTTLETVCLMEVALDWMNDAGVAAPRHCIAITDEDSWLAQRAIEDEWRELVIAPSDVGGRFSALGPFGLLPPGIVGCDLAELAAGARAMAFRCGPEVAMETHPAAGLAATLAAAWNGGQDVLVMRSGAGTQGFAAWLEQLVAESLGKNGLGFLPLLAERTMESDWDSRCLTLALETPELDGDLDCAIHDSAELGAAIYCWEFAIAILGWHLEVCPFDQPDVERAKHATGIALEGDLATVPEMCSVQDPRLAEALAAWKSEAETCHWSTIQAFLSPGEDSGVALADLACELSGVLESPVSWGWGPRYLHSTGQLHKGGPRLAALQLLDRPTSDLAIPNRSYPLLDLLHAQAAGDAAALRKLERPILHIDLGEDRAAGLRRLREEVGEIKGDG